MALKRGFCAHCKGEETLRLFDVNKESEVCYCPNCMAAMPPKEAIQNYHDLIAYYLKKASRALFETGDYLKAYQTFAHIIDLDPSIKVAYFGRILSLVYLSTLRKGKINFANILHRQEAKELFHYQEWAGEYFHFLILLLDALDAYENKMKKRIQVRGMFYDTDCIVLYLKRLQEIKLYKEFIATEANFFVDSNKDQFKVAVNRVNLDIKHYERAFKENFLTIDGYSYVFTGFAGLTPTIDLQFDEQVHKPHIIKNANLYPKDNKKSIIREEIYQTNISLAILIRLSVPLAITFFVLAVAMMISSIIVTVPTAKLFLSIGAALLAVVSLVLIVLHFASKSRLKKKYYNGTNPFILK